MEARKDGAGSDRRLVVLLHGYGTKADSLAEVEASAARFLGPGTLFHRPQLPTSTFSMADPDEIVADQLQQIDEKLNTLRGAGMPVGEIIIIGHSMGALLARKLYVVACGEVPLGPEGDQAEAPFEDAYFARGRRGLCEPRSWAKDVTRVILLAGMNRGWQVTHHLGLKKAILWTLGSGLANLINLVADRRPLGMTIRRGATFITQLRIQWICMRQNAFETRRPPGNAITVQLLGTQDLMVAPADSVDLASGADFFYLSVPWSDHEGIIDFAAEGIGAGRRAVFELALGGSVEELEQKNGIPVDDDESPEPDPTVDHVAFVIHGIRDVGHWTHQLGLRIKQRSAGRNKAEKWATETSSYGYFPMLPFLIPWYRRQKMEWLMDQYTEALARYPNATFAYVGHSNGTYLLAKALQQYPCCRFDRVVFAGSVVRRNYPWKKFTDTQGTPQVTEVLNFVATGDWVVAFFPKFFEHIRLQDLGSAGHDGFLPGSAKVSQIEWVKGAHSAAIAETYWDAIADFILDGKPPIAKAKRGWGGKFVRLVGFVPELVWLVIFAILFGFWRWGIHWMGGLGLEPTVLGVVMAAFTAVYALVIWLIVTRV